MTISEVSELYDLISRGSKNWGTRKELRLLRKTVLNSLTLDQVLHKIAFDTRRINQETDFIPRRGLQNYHRSEQFVSEAIFDKLKAFDKLNGVLERLKLEYGKEPEWQDSYTRVLASAVQNGLRIGQSDGDFSDAQPSMSSLAYLEDLLYMRYRLTPENLSNMPYEKLRTTVMQKDEFLFRKNPNFQNPSKNVEIQIPAKNSEITPADISKFSYEQMMEKMLASVAQMMDGYKNSLEEKVQTAVKNSIPTPNLVSAAAPIPAPTATNDDGKTITITIKG